MTPCGRRADSTIISSHDAATPPTAMIRQATDHAGLPSRGEQDDEAEEERQDMPFPFGSFVGFDE